MAKKKWLYTKNGRYYGDFRRYRDVGGGQEALIPEGERFATKSRKKAIKLAKARLAELRRLRQAAKDPDLRYLGPFVDHYLEMEALHNDRSPEELAQLAHRLEVAVEHFGAGAHMASIESEDVEMYLTDLKKRVRWQGGPQQCTETITDGTRRKYFTALQGLMSRARTEKVIPKEHDPCAGVRNPPKDGRREADWLDEPTGALLLEAARLYRPKREDLGISFAYELVATLVLGGLRLSEARGLEIEDIDFEYSCIRIRPNRFRRLKTEPSWRVVPLWPQLETILRHFLARRGNPTEGVLFPSPKDPSVPVSNVKRIIKELGVRIGHPRKLTSKALRHTYCAARLQTLKGGAPIQHLEIAREMGHEDTKMVEKVYGHFRFDRKQRIRREVVAFPLEVHAEALQDRLGAMRKISEERSRHAPALANRVPMETELAVIEHARENPRRGPKPTAAALQEEGVEISASGVRWVLKRYELHRAEYRLEALKVGRFDEVVKEIKELRAA